MKPEREPYIQIVAGILAVAAIPPLLVVLFDGTESLAILKNWQSGLGAFLGAFFGLGAILIGALLNADLNRRRDERLREQEAQKLAVALHAELQAAAATVYRFNQKMEDIAKLARKEPSDEGRQIIAAFHANLPEPSFKVYEANLDRLGLINPKLLTNLIMSIENARTTIARHKIPELAPSLGSVPFNVKSTGKTLLGAARRIGNEAGVKTMTEEYLEAHFTDAADTTPQD